MIPKNFARNFYSQQPVELAFLQDGANIVPLNYSLTPINLIAGNFAARYNQLTGRRRAVLLAELAKEILYLALSLILLAVGTVLLAAIFALPFKTELAPLRAIVFYTLPALLTQE